MNLRYAFYRHLAPTSPAPLALQIDRAEGVMLYGIDNKSYIDLIGGISVANVGHTHPKVVQAVQEQAARYMHLMVYGELLLSPQVQYASLLTSHLPPSLDTVYFTNSGAEAVEGAMKLAKRVTARSEIVAFHNSYHGSTQGALSIIGDEYYRNAYRPLLPDILHLTYNNHDDLEHLSFSTAAVIVEPVQAEAGVILPTHEWLLALSNRCNELGILLVFDEIQTGFGRTGTLFAFERWGIVPDVLLLGKALGGGMPLGAFVAGHDKMKLLAHQPILGHITTFGGHPVSCAAGKASMELLLENNWVQEADRKGKAFAAHLSSNQLVKEIRQIGLMLALVLDSFDTVKEVIDRCLTADNAVFADWFLFASDCIRIVPPLCISDEEIVVACATINKVCDKIIARNESK